MLLKPEDVSEYLGGLPEDKMHCSNLGVDALRYAMADYLGLLQENNPQKILNRRCILLKLVVYSYWLYMCDIHLCVINWRIYENRSISSTAGISMQL